MDFMMLLFYLTSNVKAKVAKGKLNKQAAKKAIFYISEEPTNFVNYSMIAIFFIDLNYFLLS